MVIAVSGKMAAGKNYVCSKMEKEGWASVDADELVHEAIRLNQNKILEVFSKPAKAHNLSIQNQDGSINRRELGKLLFCEKELLSIQESIVYPVISKMIDEFIASHEKTIINATVLYKTPEILARCEKIIFVTAPFFKRLFRSKKRDGLSFFQIIKRFRTQKNLLQEYKKTGLPIEIVRN